MKSKRIFLAVSAAAMLLAASPSAADTLLGSYVARISYNDHFNSNGRPLDTASQVVRQDRANFHKFGSGDGEDQYDGWFGSASGRARLQNMLDRGAAMSGATRSAIMNGQPLIEVEVYSNSVRVNILAY